MTDSIQQRPPGAEAEETPDAEWDRTFQVNITAMFHLCKAAVPHMKPGAAIVNTASVNSDKPKPQLLAYSATKKPQSSTLPADWRKCSRTEVSELIALHRVLSGRR
jgi:NADP-dependent 3-hydroxy acid dehydrogenase YdfG